MDKMSDEDAVRFGASRKALAIEKIIEASIEEVPKWVNVSPTAIATRCRSAIESAGWTIVPPKDFPGVCRRCQNFLEPNTTHSPFNGNQMFSCQIERIAPPHLQSVVDLGLGVENRNTK